MTTLPLKPFYFIRHGETDWNKRNIIMGSIDIPLPGSKMKCNALECLLKTQAQKGVANEKISPINSMGKNKDSDVKAIGVIINEDCRSA
jgi:hypothetical protein